MSQIGAPIKKYTVIPISEPISPTHELKAPPVKAPTKVLEKEKEPA